MGSATVAIGRGPRPGRLLRETIREPLQESGFVGISAAHSEIAVLSLSNGIGQIDPPTS